MKKIFPLIVAFLLSACFVVPTAQPTETPSAPFTLVAEENPYAPKIEDASLHLAGAVVTSINLSERTDLTPPRVAINFLGSMPNSCNELRLKINPPNNNYQIFIELYSLTNPKIKCQNVFQQFEANVLLGVYSSGRYTVWVNDKLVGDFIAH
jgi:hypothetical protein